MARYANAFWSPDCASGIDKLSKQSLLSLGQLHDLRRFVFNYMKYFHANGEYLTNFADTSYPIDSSFRTSRGPRVGRVASGFRQVSRSTTDGHSDLDMDYVFRQFVEKTREESRLHQRAASDIDKLVLEHITAFIKYHEPQVKTKLADLDELFEEYKQAYQDVETIKQDYETISRLGEFSIHKDTHTQEIVSKDESDEEISLTEPVDEDMNTFGEENNLKLPIVISGNSFFPDLPSFSQFIAILVKSVPITKRKIPLPGYRNEMFSSEKLCESVQRERPRGFNPTRSNLEKLGQALFDMKILVSTGFFTKKFNGEGMWFEWSDLALNLSNEQGSDYHRSRGMHKLDETWSNMTSTTTKKFNGVFKSMQNSLTKSRFSEEDLAGTEDKYNLAYSTLQKQKHLLEMKILNSSHDMEHFEKLKIELVYKSLTKLSQILSSASSHIALEFDGFCKRFVSELNNPENYLLEFDKGLETFSTGVYFPSLRAPDHPTNRNVRTSQLNTNFQNIKLNFNLFKDVPLQTQLSDLQTHIPLSLHSVPVFLYETIKALDKLPKLDLRSAWTSPLNYQQYWLMKDSLVGKFQNPEGTEIAVNNLGERDLLEIATSFLRDKDVSRSVNFVKNWLLEISDSIIPSTVHDSLVANYKTIHNDDKNQCMAETLKILGAIPRSNLSSLIFILEHIALSFQLDVLAGFGSSDEIEDAKPEVSQEKLTSLAIELNSSDAIAAVPFLHLIMRPSIVKHASGYRPPLEQYNLLLKDLLGLDTRHRLFRVLVKNEQNFIERQEQQKHNLGIHKRQEPRERSASAASMRIPSAPQIDITSTESQLTAEGNLPISPKPVKHDNFELRPFRTGATPRPSPMASPIAAKPKTEQKHSASLNPIELELEKP